MGKPTPSLLVSGLGMAMSFIQKLIDELVAQGGYPEMLYSLGTENRTAKQAIRNIATLILNSEWQVPISLLRRLTFEEASKEEPRWREHDSMFAWEAWINLDAFGIPVERFSDDPLDHKPPIPQEIADQFVGKQIVYPMIVTWKEEPHVVVNTVETVWEIGELLKKPLGMISIVPAKYLDLKH